MQPATPAWKPETLPPFPAVAVKALNLIAGRDTSLLELCNLVRSDSAFTVAILKIANSPLVAFSGNITSLVQAATLLGFRRMKSILLTVALKDYLKTPFNPLLRSCWRHHRRARRQIVRTRQRFCLHRRDPPRHRPRRHGHRHASALSPHA
jgi:hypothetical protein